MVLVSIDPGDVLGDLSDEDLVEELVSRKPSARDLAPLCQFLRVGTPQEAKEAAEDILALLMRKRDHDARIAMRKLFLSLMPEYVLSAMEHIEAGRRDAAICDLDSYISPYVQPSAATLMMVLQEKKRSNGARLNPANPPKEKE